MHDVKLRKNKLRTLGYLRKKSPVQEDLRALFQLYDRCWVKK